MSKNITNANSFIRLPAHIAYAQSLNAQISINLSHSCAQTMNLAEVIALSSKNLNSLSLDYAPIHGSEQLRSAICNYYQRYNQEFPTLTANDVLTFCGGQEALAAIYQSILVPEDEVIVCSPCYPSLITMAEQYGCLVRVVELNEANDWQLNLDEIAALMSSKTKLLVLNSPHNPTGSIIDNECSEKILNLAKQHQCYLLADEVAQASNYFQQSMQNNYMHYEKAISVGVMSKSLGLAGIRIGWVVTKNKKWLTQLTAIKASGSICISAIDQALAIPVLAHCDTIITKNNDLILQNIMKVDEFITDYNHLFQWVKPKAGMLALVRFTGEEGVEMLSQTLANEYGVLILPSYLFGLSGNYFRLGLGQQNLIEGLELLKKYCENR